MTAAVISSPGSKLTVVTRRPHGGVKLTQGDRHVILSAAELARLVAFDRATPTGTTPAKLGVLQRFTNSDTEE
ncbi:hypothetical protein JDV09_16905 [Mycobacterium sp. Y57]|uniref:hypothetical protein n=1 Tax=Mycolicibacterium xanthum TaxID=2796469 RepID=UPI001C84D091|nr:hypothetical protein [Mycolicibacterium xanthum]MBX7433775.1 hypothetical protein [Mycolicibacterium xanthum]